MQETMTITRKIEPTWTKLAIRPGAYYDCVIPEQVRKIIRC